MRNLQTRDLFDLARLVKKLDIKKDLNEIDLEKGQEKVGIDIIFTVLEKASDKGIENSVYEFLSKPFEITKEEIACMDPIELIDGIFKIASIEKWKTFIKQALQ